MASVPDPSIPASPLDELLGFRLTEISARRVVGVLPVTPKLHQPFGILHGGALATVVETASSYGATAALGGSGQAVGLSNHTDFVRAVRDGQLRVEAMPLQVGQSTQLWQVRVSDEQDRLVAHGRVRLMNLRQTP
jgi:1,4-dihydroxy-2-naphthoyl-CoA hydrolase